ncbi:MAG TPA: hypothetical protein VGM18_06960 [Candidatus Sulfotelmatobacter sp.]|jgi:hypothetical protein
MTPGKADWVRICLFLLFLLPTVPAYCQRGTLDLNLGETTDQFASLPSVSDAVLDINGDVTVIRPSQKHGGPSIVAGGEIRVPSDTNNHSKEFAVYGGAIWGVHNFSIGFDGGVRKIYMPPARVSGQTLNRDNLETLELPLVIRYKFGPEKRAFLEVKGAPELTPHYKRSSLNTVPLPSPSLDHGYFLRGRIGYNFGKWWYVAGTYETRYFKFESNLGNPSNLYNWKSNIVTGGVGLRF